MFRSLLLNGRLGISEVKSKFSSTLITKRLQTTISQPHSATAFTKNTSTTLPGNKVILKATTPAVGYWLLGTSALVFGIVIVGGLTRLTESGLSMVDWSLLGSRPPANQQEWEAYFEKYKQFPEYKVLKKNMTVDEFKNIYWYEYGHRMLGRVIGAFFILPATYFILRKKVNVPLRNRLLLIGSMIGFQGLLGWYMVKSGLDHSLVENQQVPRVSAYRLAAHLGSAFVIYMTTLYTAFSVLGCGYSPQLTKQFGGISDFKRLKMGVHTLAGMIFLTAMSGAFVAGLDAGMIYNSFPKMAEDAWTPSDYWALRPKWLNFFENPSAVQFNHRVLAISTYTALMGLYAFSFRLNLPFYPRLGLHLLAAAGNMQVGLGILTLLWMVPIPLASAHQTGSLTLLSVVLWLIHLLRKSPIK